MTASGTCPVDGCNRPCDTTTYVVCRRCWRDVPRELASAMYRAWGKRVRTGIVDGPDVEAHEQAKRDVVEACNAARAEREPQLGLGL